MSISLIITVPNEILVTKCEPITQFGEETQKLVSDLLDTIKVARDPEGAGLAAPQIGVTKRVCVVRRFTGGKGDSGTVTTEDYVLINPVITKFSNKKDIVWEGCLSIPDVTVQVERSENIIVKAKDRDGENIKLNASGFFARVIQHEVDHLNGILITDKVI